MIGPLALIVLICAPFFFIVARRPILRRLALRNAVRRPREATLVVLGSLLGAAIITGSLVVGDTMDASMRQIARTHLGPVDELVVVPDHSLWSQAVQAANRLPRKDIDGVLPLATLDAAASAGGGPYLRSAPRSQVVAVDFRAARHFGDDPAATGIRGPTPPNGHAAVTTDLAKTLHLRVGDIVEVWAYGIQTPLFVDRIFPRRGIAGFWLGAETEARNVLVSPATFDSILQARARRGAPPTWAVAISNRGGIESGAARTNAVKELLEHSPGTSAGQVIAVKQAALDQARALGKGFRDMFTGTGMFGVLAGLLLLINLFVMLAEERKPELGMARAVGMSRKSLVGAFVTEGWFYALVATAIGTLTGIGLGRVLVTVSERVFSTSHNRFELFFNVVPGSIATAFAVSLAVAVLSVLAMSIRVSRLNIIRAIRDIPEPPSRRNDRRRLLVGGLTLAAGGAWAATAIPANRPAAVLLAPMLVAAGIVPLVSRFTPSRVPASTCAVAVILWGALVFRFDNAAAEGAGIMIFVAQGIALTTAAVVLASLQQDKIGAVLRRLVARRSLSARLGLAYPLARRSRTGLTVAMYALVVFILTFIATIAHLINAQVDTTARQLSGGYDVVFSSSAANPVDPTSLASTKGVVRVAPLGTTTASFTVLGVASDERWRLTSFDRRFIDKAPPQLDDRGQYPSDAAAWQAVLRDPNLIIVDPVFLQSAGGPPAYQVSIGMTMTLANPSTGAWRTVRVAAISVADGFINNGALYGAPGGRSLFGALVTPNRAYVALAPGIDPDRFAAALQARHFRNGVEAASIRALVDEGFAVTNQMFQLFEGYLALGLVVGVAGLGVVMVRAVRERRRQIGTLRAIGFSSKTVGRSFALEGGFIAIEGTVIGVSLALVTLYSIVAGGEAFGPLAFTVPILMLAVLLVGTIAASLLATVGPALSATKTRPAVALRITD